MNRNLWRLAEKAFVAIIAFALTLTSPPALAQSLAQGNDVATASYAQILGVIIFLLLLGVAAWFVVRAKGATLKLWTRAEGRRLQLIETVRVTPHAMLVLARLEDKEYLIAFASNNSQLIDVRHIGNSGEKG